MSSVYIQEIIPQNQTWVGCCSCDIGTLAEGFDLFGTLLLADFLSLQ